MPTYQVRSAKVMFRVTREEHQALLAWAKRDHRSLANLVYALVRAQLERQGAAAQSGRQDGHPTKEAADDAARP